MQCCMYNICHPNGGRAIDIYRIILDHCPFMYTIRKGKAVTMAGKLANNPPKDQHHEHLYAMNSHYSPSAKPFSSRCVFTLLSRHWVFLLSLFFIKKNTLGRFNAMPHPPKCTKTFRK